MPGNLYCWKHGLFTYIRTQWRYMSSRTGRVMEPNRFGTSLIRLRVVARSGHDRT